MQLTQNIQTRSRARRVANIYYIGLLVFGLLAVWGGTAWLAIELITQSADRAYWSQDQIRAEFMEPL